MSPRSIRCILVPALLLVTATSQGATFCVQTASQLQSALTIAGSNSQDDAILITAGTFSREGGFTLSIDDGNGLEITGGWMPSLGNSCSHLQPDPWLTRIDGQFQHRGLGIELVSHGYLYINELTIQNGVAPVLLGVDGSSGTGSAHGGGLEIKVPPGNPGPVILERVVFINNAAHGDGGGLMLAGGGTTTLSNNLFINNSAGGQAGAARFIGPGTLRMIGNTAAYNQAFGPGAIDGIHLGGGGGVLANNLLWGNGGADGRDLLLGHGGFVLRHNNVGSLWGLPPAPGSVLNLSVDPQFRGGCSNVRLAADSPLVDAGTLPSGGDPWLLPTYDLDGHFRLLDGSPDIGAFELESLFRDGFDGPSPCPAPL